MPHRLTILAALAGAVCLGAGTPDGKPPRPAEDQVLFGDLPQVEAAALHTQSLAEAPANVSIITAADIRHYGYRTLAEALSSVRGFYTTYDHTYHFVGVRGVSLPGDFNTRFLVMLNGHPLTDNIYNSNGFFGQDFGLDMDLVERIEIIRGPTSALYGSNGMLANINVVTRSPVDGQRLTMSAETDSFHERKLSLSSTYYLGRGANLLISGSAFNNAGLSFPGEVLGLPPTGATPRQVDGTDGERGYHSFANLIWHGWSFEAYFNSRDKQPPVGLGTSLSGDPTQHVVDGRNLLGATYKHQTGPGELRWQAFYDQYRYRDRYNYPVGDTVQEVRDYNRGDWVNSQITYELPVEGVGSLTVGLDGFWELRSQQYNLVDGIRQGLISAPDRGVAVFAQQEWSPSTRWKLYGGLRLDWTRNFDRFLSPRVAAVFQASPRTTWKAVYGRPFRNPSAFEQFYNDGGLSYAAAARLRPEGSQTFEASLERQVARGLSLVVNGFHYRVDDAIEAVTLENGAQQYQNAGGLRTTGVELEARVKLWDRVESSASLALSDGRAADSGLRLPNSPRQVSKIRAGVPFFRDRLFLAGALATLSSRLTGDGSRLGGAWLADFTATVKVNSRFDVQGGVRNAFDCRYQDPIYLAIDHLPGDGRSVFLRLVWRVWE